MYYICQLPNKFTPYHIFRRLRMKMFPKYSKWLLPFVLAAFIGSSAFVGCTVDNSGPSNAPQQSVVTQDELGPAIDVKNRHTDEIMSIDGVNGIGVGVNE